MLLRHLVTHFLQQQAKAKFAEVVRSGGAAASKSPPRATPLLVDGVVVYPTDLEAGGLLDLTNEKSTHHCEGFLEQRGLLGSRHLVFIETGEGAKASQTLTTALTLLQPLWILSLGFASGLAPSLRKGEILMPSRILARQGAALEVGLKLSADQPKQAGLHLGDLLTVDALPKSPAEKKELAASGALAWDADSYFAAQAAAASPLFVSIRIISEAFDEELPKPVKAFQEQKSLAAKLGAATGALLDQPSSLKAMWKLRDDALRLSDRLAKFAQGVIGQLPLRSSSVYADWT